MVGACPEQRRVEVGEHVRGGRALARGGGASESSRGCVPMNLPVRVFTATFDRYDGNQIFLVINVVNHTPVADADAPAFQPTQFPTSRWTRVVFQSQNGLGNAAKVRLADAVQLPACFMVEEFNPVL